MLTEERLRRHKAPEPILAVFASDYLSSSA